MTSGPTVDTLADLFPHRAQAPWNRDSWVGAT
jgi:hypothetical protein